VITAITNGSMESCATEHLAMLNLNIPTDIAGVDKAYLNPRNNWADTAEYDEQAAKLAGLFIKNIIGFAPSQDVIAAGPQL
jgi:phosphoenolpyruvate carboxykinase (ATP)